MIKRFPTGIFSLRNGLWLAALAVVAGLSCKKDANPPAIVDIPVTFQLQMREKLGFPEGRRPLEFHISSMEALDCQNYTIDYSVVQNGKKIHLTLNDFILPGPCSPGEGIAKASFTVGVLGNGNYPLTISLKDLIENEGLIEVTGNAFSIKLQTTDGIWVNPGTLYRIPENTIWGEMIPDTDTASALASAFLAELEPITETLNLKSGSYGYFTIEENGSVVLADTKKGDGNICFYYSYNGGRDELASLVDEYRQAAGGGLLIRVYDSEGGSY